MNNKYTTALRSFALWPYHWMILAAIFILTSPSPSSALIIWGYNGSAAMEKQYRFTIVDATPSYLTLRRNLDRSFILANDLDYLSGVGTRVFTDASSRVTAVDHATVTLVTPKHLLVAAHYGIWNQANTFAFVGTDNRMYLARSKPGFTVLKDLSRPWMETDIVLVELETALPSAVVPLHVANFTTQHRQQVTVGMPAYHVGNMHLNLNYASWDSFGNAYYKGIGTNKIKNAIEYASFTFVDTYLVRPTNASSQNWSDYWNTRSAPLPPVGTAFPRANDSSGPVMIKIKDAANRTRLHVIGFHWGTQSASVIGFVYPDLVSKIVGYNAINRTNYSINNTALNPVPTPISPKSSRTVEPVNNLNSQVMPSLRTTTP